MPVNPWKNRASSELLGTLGKVHLLWPGEIKIFLDTRKGGSEKLLGRGSPKICVLQNQHMTSSYRSDGF